jgi:hypothetical protein
MKKSIVVLASLLALNLTAAEADYATQQESADKAFNELDGKEADNKEIELQKKELEIERLKLELEKKQLAEERQKAQQPAPQAYQAPSRPAQQPYRSSFYIGFETYNASGTRTKTAKNSSGSTLWEVENDIDFAQQALKIGFGELSENRITIDILSGRDISYEGTSLYKDGTGFGLTWDVVMSSLYDASSESNLLPFLRLGFAIGSYEYLDEYAYLYEDDSASTVELKLGFGLFYQINKTFELAVSYDMNTAALAYEDSVGNKLEITDQVSGIALGFNAHF